MCKYLVFVLLLKSLFLLKSRVVSRYSDVSYNNVEIREMVYLQILTSNGHHAPLNLYPNDENSEENYSNGMGVLTQLGKWQQFEFGKFLRKFYDFFITSSPLEVDAFSSREDRSTASLLSLLASLYEPSREWQFSPGLRWQPITMCVLEEGVNDPFFGYPDYCEGQHQEFKRLLSSKHMQDFINKDEVLYSFWANNSGLPFVSFLEAADLYDIIQKEDEAGLKFPEWARTHIRDMKRTSDFAYRWRYNSTKSLQLKVGLLMDFLRIRMEVYPMEGNPTPDIKVSVYMTHDWNIAAVLSSMRNFNGVRPPPCATIVFELYRQRRQVGDTFDYSVRTLFFNSSHPELGLQEPNLIILDGCETEFCPVEQFVRFFDYVVPVNYSALCGGDFEDYSVKYFEETNIYPMYYDLLNITKSPL